MKFEEKFMIFTLAFSIFATMYGLWKEPNCIIIGLFGFLILVLQIGSIEYNYGKRK